MSQARGLGKQVLNVSSLASLILLLIVGGIKKDALALYLSSLGLAFKSARVITQEIETRDYDRLMRAATEPLRIENTRLSYDLGSQRSENAVLKEADRLLWQRADEAEKVAARIRDEFKALETKLAKANHATSQALKQVKEKEDQLTELDLYNERMSVQLNEHRSILDQKVNIQKDENRKLEQNLKDAQKSFREKLEKAHSEVDEAREALATSEAQVAVLRDEIARLNRAKTLAEGVDTHDLANKIVEWFGKAKFVVDAESTNVSGSDWVLVFRLRNQKDSFRIREYAQQMKIDFSLYALPSFKVDGDKLRITIHRGEIENEAKYLRIDPTWLQEALVFEKSGNTVTHHARFSGSTETGKSTLVCNAVGVLIRRIPLVEIELADPLIAGQSQWSSMTPKYKGEESCVEGFLRFYEEFKQLDNGSIKSDRTKVFIMDEFDRVMQNHAELLPMVLDLWKSGRHQKRYLWVLGQSALVGKFSLNMEDVQNVIGFYLGNTIDRGLTDANDDPEYNSKLRQEWHHAKARELRYLCLCRPMTVTGRPFLAVMPKPDTYELGKGQESLRRYDEGKEEVQLENRLVEFDLDSAKQDLEKLVNLSQEPQKDLTLGVTSKERVKVEKLLREGLSASKVVKEVWGISPSRNEPYPTRKAQVECIKKTI